MLAGLWIVAVVAVSAQAAAQHNNNFEIFRTAWFNLLAGADLYAPSPRHRDLFKYTPTFAVLFAPLAVVPFWLGMLAWNALNAGALYWGLGRALDAEQAFAARAIVLLDTIGSMQNAQSNALIAGLMIVALAELERRRELRAAVAIAVATLIKVFPIVAASFAIFRPYRLPRFALRLAIVTVVLLALPLLVISPDQLVGQYRSWAALSRVDALDRGFSIMQQLHLWFGYDGPNWPVQATAVAVLVAPLARYAEWGTPRFRRLYLASVLMFAVLFNHKAESPAFVIAVAGVAVWFATAPRTRAAWALLAVVAIGTILSSSDLMPVVLQRRLFDPYRLKVLPVFLVWVVVQRELWTQSARAPLPSAPGGPAAPAR